MAVETIRHACWSFTARRPPTARRRHSTTCRASSRTLHPEAVPKLRHLPPVAFSYEAKRVNVAELADLLQQVACFAPGQSFDSTMCGSQAVTIDPHRLQGALHRSLFFVAAYVNEHHLPPQQHLASRGLAPQQAVAVAAAPWPTLPRWNQQQQQQRRVLVGFARAVGDAEFVATVHDVAVMPELQQLGLGRQLLTRLLRQLVTADIADIGLLAPASCQGFFRACSFGRDSEGSTTMTLPQDRLQQGWREELPLPAMRLHIRQPGLSAP
ncbi:hypothetical protein D9Q98_001074 [Chlorella vulgaris]|uniref:N-acetyltransferase domain-containing protein n=1 Tax=Chlorella vulgaris TaxID=3077 RepID=A0A9D4Z2M6_CHLVU|nr:hypothetical protein D9Q98_001074 [Chlorella vulgaris]